MKNKHTHICIAGAAGQGVATIGQIMAKALVREGFSLHGSQVYESRVRGGSNTFSLRVGRLPIAAPTEEIDILVALNEAEIVSLRENMAPDGIILSDDAAAWTSKTHLRIPLADMGKGARANTVMAGALSGLLGFDLESMKLHLMQYLGKLSPAALESNSAVFVKAHAWGRSQQAPPQLPLPGKRKNFNLMMNGNEAIALGAMAAGVKFCAFYPMSPSTSIPLALADEAVRMGIVIEQTEDEIAAINMAIGASYAGARSMVATSGGGMALMSEGVSLAAMTEVPVVIIIAMRPGPATGLPARTEQADLNLALYAGHGEFPRAIFSPASLQECFDLTRKAFELADRYQGPMFLLTDQYLADSYRDAEPFVFAEAQPVCLAPEQVDPVYERYALTENGISPRLFPGFGHELVVSDSDEHTPDGHITEDPAVRIAMQNKRMEKLNGLRKEVVAPSFSGDTPCELLLVCWGSTRGAVEEAADLLRENGRQVRVCHFSQVYPLRPAEFLDQFRAAGETVIIEGNATSQLASLIRSTTSFTFDRHILRYDGLAMTAAYILDHLESATPQ